MAHTASTLVHALFSSEPLALEMAETLAYTVDRPPARPTPASSTSSVPTPPCSRDLTLAAPLILLIPFVGLHIGQGPPA